MATTQGGTRDMGTQLTTLVMWHKQLELKLRGLNQWVCKYQTNEFPPSNEYLHM